MKPSWRKISHPSILRANVSSPTKPGPPGPMLYRKIEIASPLIMKSAGAKSLFEARVFGQLVVLARKYVELGRSRPEPDAN